MPSTREKVIVGLSGGVDSSVTALLLKQQGYEVEALFMKNWDEDDGTEYCTARVDLEDALRVADQLQIELHIAHFARDYWDSVFTFFLDEYKNGRTPNPDVLCNREIKFRVFADHARKLGARWIATGHYANVVHSDSGPLLYKGVDDNKDQSYFLNAVAQHQLRDTLFPLANYLKPSVRELARAQGIVTQDKKDSTGICFIGERRFKDFLQKYLPAQPGPIVDESGIELGVHQGIMYHTIGQRQGLGIGGRRGSADQAWYVADKCIETNALTVVQGNSHPLLFTDQIDAANCNWIGDAPRLPLRCQAKVRYRQPDQDCTVNTGSNGGLSVVFDHPQRAVTPGQYVVFYSAERQCLGGAIIERTKRNPV